MLAKVYPCWYKIPESGIIDGFTGLWQAKCTYCREVCDPPIVDSKIGFWDGFGRNGSMIAILIPIIIISIGYEIFKFKYMTPKACRDFEKLKKDEDEEEEDDDKVDV